MKHVFNHSRGRAGSLILTSLAVAIAVLGLGVTGGARAATSARASASAGGTAASKAVTAGHAHRAKAGVVALGRAPGARRTQQSSPQCFYTIPDCTSTNPDATFGLVSAGDTTGCEFEAMVDWGDGNTTDQSFAGGPDGSLLITFDHTYTDFGVYTINWTATVTSGSDACGDSSDQLQFTYASAQVVAVRYAPTSKTAPGTPGLPVIKDDNLKDGKADPVLDHGWGPDQADCDGLYKPTDYDWLDCSQESDSTDKNWPVIYASTDTLTVDAAVFIAPARLDGPVTLSATASIDGQTLMLASAPLSESALGDDQYEYSASDLTFSGAMPTTVGFDQLAITWTIITADNSMTPAGTSTSPVYLTADSYTQPLGITDPEPPYITLLDVGTQAATGQSAQDPNAVYAAIWQQFESLAIAHPILDPQTGEVTYGHDFTYYGDGFTTIGSWWNTPFDDCPLFAQFLATDVGQCGNFAEFLAGVLAYQGIVAGDFKLKKPGLGFYPGPAPAAGLKPYAYGYMLVGPSLWTFGTESETGPYPYADAIEVRNGKVRVTQEGLTYSPSTAPIAQGPVTTPRQMFWTGDHAITFVFTAIADPSYGMPQSATPYDDVLAWEQASVAGFAVIYYKQDDKPDAPYLPLPLKDDVATVCASHKCQFRAVPYQAP